MGVLTEAHVQNPTQLGHRLNIFPEFSVIKIEDYQVVELDPEAEKSLEMLAISCAGKLENDQTYCSLLKNYSKDQLQRHIIKSLLNWYQKNGDAWLPINFSLFCRRLTHLGTYTEDVIGSAIKEFEHEQKNHFGPEPKNGEEKIYDCGFENRALLLSIMRQFPVETTIIINAYLRANNQQMLVLPVDMRPATFPDRGLI